MLHLTLLVLLTFGLVTHSSGDSLLSEAKVVGGTAASISTVPYQVSLQLSGSHFCCGSIYNSRYIITAAHCVKAVTTPTNIKIRYGSSYWASGGTLIGVSSYLVHPSYDNSTMQYDIALLKTNVSIVWSSDVKSVYLADTEPANNTVATISGWGTLYSGATTLPSQLQTASVQIISRSVCQTSLYGYGTSIGTTMICAGANGTDTCQGDSGGPLIAAGTQVGIVSWGSGCAASYYPGVYSSVPVLKSFVKTYVNTL